MTPPDRKLLVVQCAALGANLFKDQPLRLGGVDLAPLAPPVPGVTCVSQATFRTGETASRHGMIANGLYHRLLRKPLFWEQAASHVAGPRIWDDFRAAGGTVGMMFWQQSLGEQVDLVVSPRPIHKHSGGMIQANYTRPASLEDRLVRAVGKPFNLMHYWGPLASRKSSDWIVDATTAVLDAEDLRPDLLLTYLPHLDYDTQRHGIDHPKAAEALTGLDAYLARLRDAADRNGYDLLIWGDYAMKTVTGPAIFPNRVLREHGWLDTQNVKGMAYPDLFAARAFAMVDHEVAHVYIPDPADLPGVRDALQALDGVASVLPRADLPELDHPHSGELVAFSEPGRGFAYPWWTDPREAPDFATHVDIHNKPGFDPCELFFGRVPWQVSTDTSKIGGTHGAPGPDAHTVWGGSLDLDLPPDSPLPLHALARAVNTWLR